jgi:hypothetical protein
LATTRRKETTNDTVAVLDGSGRLLLRQTGATRVVASFVFAFIFGIIGAAAGGGVGLLVGAGAGVALGLFATRGAIWTFARSADAILDHNRKRIRTVAWVEQIKVKGERRVKEGRLVHYVALVGPGSQVKIGRWTPDRVGPVVTALASYLNVPVMQKGEPMPGTVPPVAAVRR